MKSSLTNWLTGVDNREAFASNNIQRMQLTLRHSSPIISHSKPLPCRTLISWGRQDPGCGQSGDCRARAAASPDYLPPNDHYPFLFFYFFLQKMQHCNVFKVFFLYLRAKNVMKWIRWQTRPSLAHGAARVLARCTGGFAPGNQTLAGRATVC